MTEATRFATGATCLVMGLADLVFMNTVVLPRALPGFGRATSVSMSATGNDAARTATPTAPAPAPPAIAIAAALPAEPQPAVEPPPEPTIEPAVTPEPPLLASTAVYFSTAASRLDRTAQRSVDELADRLAALLQEERTRRVIVDGHADARGDESLNDRLSHRRALAVSARLKAHGVEPSRIVVRRFGAARPAARGTEPASLRLNRRVEITLGGGKS